MPLCTETSGRTILMSTLIIWCQNPTISYLSFIEYEKSSLSWFSTWTVYVIFWKNMRFAMWLYPRTDFLSPTLHLPPRRTFHTPICLIEGKAFAITKIISSIGSSMVRRGGGGARNMKYKGPPMAAIFFMTSFNRDRGGPWPPWPPPGSAADITGADLRGGGRDSAARCQQNLGWAPLTQILDPHLYHRSTRMTHNILNSKKIIKNI